MRIVVQFDDEANILSALRWVARGLPVSLAIRKVWADHSMYGYKSPNREEAKNEKEGNRMKLGIVADTHLRKKGKQLPPALLRGLAGVDLILQRPHSEKQGW
ncbi:metallophosphoesterase family protein [Brevibacillus massiliensis]|nr:hypothetical protein [Brevibacillus massiliensis]